MLNIFHANGSTTSGSCPSGDDVATIYDKQPGHVIIVDTENGRYALVVEDASKMDTFKRIQGNGPALFGQKVLLKLATLPGYWSTGSVYVQATIDALLSSLGSANTCGIGFYKASSTNGNTFTKLN